jgi:uncharacterized membrane protein HdeD (DUF308 family)
MKIGILLFIVGAFLIIYLSNIKHKKRFMKNIGIIFGILIVLYSIIALIQPDNYIAYTKTTISK